MDKIRLFFKYFKQAKRYAWLLVTAFFSDLTISMLTMLPPLFSIVIFDYAYPNRDLTLFTYLILASLIIYFIDNFFSGSIDYVNLYIDQQIGLKFSQALFSKIQKMPIYQLKRGDIGNIIVNLTEDISQVTDLLTAFFSVLLTNIAKLGFFLYVILKIDYRIMVLALLSVPLYIIETKFLSDKLEDTQRNMLKAESNIVNFIQERLINLRTIKAFSQEEKEARNLITSIKARNRLNIKEKLISIISLFANSITLRTWSVVVVWYLGYELIQGFLTIGELVALAAYIPILQEPISQLSNLYTNSKVCYVSLTRIDSIMSSPVEETEDKGMDLPDCSGRLEFREVSFRYSPEMDVLKNISIEIPPNSSVAIVGASGAGKTTMLNLIMRFYPTTTGAIYIDGRSILEIKLSSLRKNVGAVFQEILLFEGTIKENILYGNEGKSDDEVVVAAKKAHIHDFIELLPDKYDTVVQPQGVNLSVGQRQRIALARLFLYDPKIIILDEVTSALDAESEFLIQEAIQHYLGKKTLFIIAHRMATIKKVDKIIVLDNGEISEFGTYDELLNRKGLFFRFYSLQTGGFEEFRRRFEIEFQRQLRYKQDITLLALQIDNYEDLAKRFSFDKLISFMNEIDLFIKKQIRIMDFSTIFEARWIFVGLPEIDLANGVLICRRLKEVFDRHIFQFNGGHIRCSVSIGVVSCREADIQYGEDVYEKAIDTVAQATQSESGISVYGKIDVF